MLFQGQEFFSSSPFLYFTDHSEPLGSMVVAGRRQEFGAFAMFSDEKIREMIPSPQDPLTFQQSKLDWNEARFGGGALGVQFHRELIQLRRTLPVLIRSRESRSLVKSEVRDGVLFISIVNDAGRATIVLNLGREATVAAGAIGDAEVVLHSEEARFGGSGGEVSLAGGMLTLPGRCAVVLITPA